MIKQQSQTLFQTWYIIEWNTTKVGRRNNSRNKNIICIARNHGLTHWSCFFYIKYQHGKTTTTILCILKRNTTNVRRGYKNSNQNIKNFLLDTILEDQSRQNQVTKHSQRSYTMHKSSKDGWRCRKLKRTGGIKDISFITMAKWNITSLFLTVAEIEFHRVGAATEWVWVSLFGKTL